MWASLFRFGEIRLARQLFYRVDCPTILSRELFSSHFKLDVSRSEFHQLLYLQGERTIPERELVRRLLKADMHVVDVGANIGYYAALFRTILGDTGRISCFEPSPENLAELKNNIAENKWRNVTVFEYAVGNVDGMVGLRSGINSGVVPIADGVFTSPVRPLDAVIVERCDFLKIDVEGFECQVLEGAAKVIDRDRPILFLECHPLLIGRHNGSIRWIMQFLSRYYSEIEAFDVAARQGMTTKIAIRYLHREPVRRIKIDRVAESRLYEGRLYGTFWLVCLP